MPIHRPLLIAFGRVITAFLEETGRIVAFSAGLLRTVPRRPFRTKLLVQHIEFIGLRSLGIIVLTGFFTGAVFALQTGRIFRIFNADGYTGMVVGISLARELAPVLTGLMVTARAGSAIAANIATMKVTEQIDALQVMAVDPVNYLVVPRFLAALLSLPALTALFNFVGIVGSYIVGVWILGINEGEFLYRIEWLVDPDDVVHGLAKSAVFGAIIVVISSYKGILARGGALGVGKATTEAVVLASVLIFVVDYLITALV